MVTIDITIKKNDVYDEVGRISAYLGQRKSGADASAYERVGVTDSDGALLDSYWSMAKSALVEQLEQYVDDKTDDKADDTWTLSLVARGRYNTEMTPYLQADAMRFMANYMMSLWCGVCSDGAADYYLKMSGTLLQDMKNKLCSFTKPKKKSITSKNKE